MRHNVTTPKHTVADHAHTRFAVALDACRVARAEHSRAPSAATQATLDAAIAGLTAAQEACP